MPLYEMVLWVWVTLLLPVYVYMLLPVYQKIRALVRMVHGLYAYRVTLMIQALICYWRGCLYFERSSLWVTLLKKEESEGKSYLLPLLWTIHWGFPCVMAIIVVVTALAGETNVRRVINVQGRIGCNLYCLGKSVGEALVLRLMVFIGDNVADPSVAEIHIASFFACFYLAFVSFWKLCYLGNDLGFVDGIASVILSTLTHYLKGHWSQLICIIGTTVLIWAKNKYTCTGLCCQPPPPPPPPRAPPPPPPLPPPPLPQRRHRAYSGIPEQDYQEARSSSFSARSE